MTPDKSDESQELMREMIAYQRQELINKHEEFN